MRQLSTNILAEHLYESANTLTRNLSNLKPCKDELCEQKNLDAKRKIAQWTALKESGKSSFILEMAFAAAIREDFLVVIKQIEKENPSFRQQVDEAMRFTLAAPSGSEGACSLPNTKTGLGLRDRSADMAQPDNCTGALYACTAGCWSVAVGGGLACLAAALLPPAHALCMLAVFVGETACTALCLNSHCQ